MLNYMSISNSYKDQRIIMLNNIELKTLQDIESKYYMQPNIKYYYTRFI